MENFWTSLKKPFFILAPMDGVTDFAFRETIAEVAKPDVLMTEFTNVDSLFSAGSEKSLERLKISELQKPVVLQVWGINPENFRKTAELAIDKGFSGIDINMGCPSKSVMKRKAGAGLINNPDIAIDIIRATKEGAKNEIAVSVKTRLGVNKDVSDDWIKLLLQQKVDALTVHFRLAKDESRGKAAWEKSIKFVQMRDSLSAETLIIGNGDVTSYKQGASLHEKYNVDGIMIGRGVFSNPWIFESNPNEKSVLENVKVFKRHIEIHKQTWGDDHKFWELKKFIKMYLRNFDGSNKLRIELMDTKSLAEFENKICDIEKQLQQNSQV